MNKYKLVPDKGTDPADVNQRKEIKCSYCNEDIKIEHDAYYVVDVNKDQWVAVEQHLVCSEGCAELYMHAHSQDAPKYRKLKANWTIETPAQLKAIHGLDVEEEITKNMAKEFRQAIDKKIIEDINLQMVKCNIKAY